MRRSAVCLLLLVLPLPVLAQDNLGAPLQVPGLSDTVRLLRDGHDIPHIFAKNDADALFTLGWVHAQDRLFQMDLLRRTFSGSLAELVGEAALDSDSQLRTLGLRRAAEASLPALTPETRVWLEAYARGVNAWIADASHPLPLEYSPLELTRASIPAWTPVDSIVIAKGLAFSLSFDLTDIDLTIAFNTFVHAGQQGGFNGDILFREDVYRTAPFDPTVSIPGFLRGQSGSAAEPAWLDRAAELAGLYRERVRAVPLLRRTLERQRDRGSNWWIASGKVTDSGRPILANDPHLGLDTPSIFYEAQIRSIPGADGGGPLNAFGVTFPGIPAIVLGCNPRVCWGATTNPMDVTDVYMETLTLAGPGFVPTGAIFEGQPRPVVLIPQTFRRNQPGDGIGDNLVDGGSGVAVVLPHRNNAPIVQFANFSDGHEIFALSVQYTGWGATREMDAFRIWNRAGSLAEFEEGLLYFDVGSQNWAYADVAGNIAYWTSGELPLREDLETLEHADGGIPPFFIRDGTHTLRHEWLPLSSPPGPLLRQATPFAVLPQSEMPHAINPKRGWVANANNDPIGTSNDNDPLNQVRRGGRGLLYLGPYYDRGYRIGQIDRLLKAELARNGKFSVRDFERIQANNQLLDAQVFVPYIRQAFRRAEAAGATSALGALAADAGVREAVGRLAAWNFSTPPGIPEGYDPFDDPLHLPQPSAAEIRHSVAATIYSVWRSQVVQRGIDGTLAGLGLSDVLPGGDVALANLRHLLDTFNQTQGRGASGIQFFTDPAAANPAQARDIVLLESLRAALDLLAGPAFASAFGGSANQNDYRWGKLHRVVFDHPLGGPFSIPPSGGILGLPPPLPGISRSGGFGAVDASGHNVRADSANEFMFGSGPARRFIGEMKKNGPVAKEVIPGGESGVPGNPFQTDQLLLWLTNRYHPWPYRPADVLDAAVTDEVLTP
ncbi:MAG TPA: penicillin acylase family protein [Thermoanaerobaculia bacterium]|nr:penicillin acylase family protein [Thermoanaerobaculia bacterium]